MLNRIFNLIDIALKTFVPFAYYINMFDKNYIFTDFILINYKHKYTLYT